MLGMPPQRQLQLLCCQTLEQPILAKHSCPESQGKGQLYFDGLSVFLKLLHTLFRKGQGS